MIALCGKVTGFTGNSGFVEALGPPTVHHAFERWLGYCREDGKWHQADTASTGGAKFFKLIEDDTVLRYDRAEPDSPENKSGEFVTKQPDQPQLDQPEIADATAVANGNPDEVEAVVKAIEKFDRKIVLSLSPGGRARSSPVAPAITRAPLGTFCRQPARWRKLRSPGILMASVTCRSCWGKPKHKPSTNAFAGSPNEAVPSRI